MTVSLGFVLASSETAANEFMKWQSDILAEYGLSLSTEQLHVPSFDSLFEALLPRQQVVPTKHIFVPTKTKWTAYFNNFRCETDSAGPMAVLARRLKTRAMTIHIADDRGLEFLRVQQMYPKQFGATVFELFGEDGKHLRSIACINDGGRWVFEQSGSPILGEETKSYSLARKKDRFTAANLLNLISLFDIELTSPAFFDLEEPAFLFERK